MSPPRGHVFTLTIHHSTLTLLNIQGDKRSGRDECMRHLSANLQSTSPQY
jgi:hypothetical protein